LGRCAIKKYFDEYGIENFKIELLKEYQIEDKKHLRAYEQLWMNKFKCINEKNSLKFLYFKYIYNEKAKIKSKKNYEKNKNKIYEKNREYRKNNIEKYKEKQKEYRKNKIKCLCGSNISYSHFSRHKRSKKHLDFIAKKEEL
jgi:hypothetical protein